MKHPLQDEHGRYGWAWGDLEIIRLGEMGGNKVLQIQKGKREIQIYVSPTGRSIRVYDGERELK